MERNTQTIQKDTRVKEATETLNMLDNSFYWLNAMIKQDLLTEGQAGYILTVNKDIL